MAVVFVSCVCVCVRIDMKPKIIHEKQKSEKKWRGEWETA